MITFNNESRIMKTKIFIIIILGMITINAQSVLTLGAGTNMVIGTGADFCAGSIEGSGQLLGNGTFCGNPTDVESETDNTLPTKYALEQNYPNPFNPSTKIRYSIPNVGSGFAQTVLKVYDVLGNEVVTLVNEEKLAGSYEVNFNAAQLSSGIYFYRLQTGAYVQMRKMILLK